MALAPVLMGCFLSFNHSDAKVPVLPAPCVPLMHSGGRELCMRVCLCRDTCNFHWKEVLLHAQEAE